jgi:hypothetical protein
MSNNEPATSGIGLGGIVFIVFLVLKLCNIINWSWWWVTAPLWLPSMTIIVIAIIVGILTGIIKGLKK